MVADAALKVRRKVDAGQKVRASHGAKDVAASQAVLQLTGALAKGGQLKAGLAIKVARKVKAVRGRPLVLTGLDLAGLELGVLVQDGLTLIAVMVAVMRAEVIRGHALARVDLRVAEESLVVVNQRLLVVSLRVQVVGLRDLEGKKVVLGVLRVR